jgi:uridine kinase
MNRFSLGDFLSSHNPKNTRFFTIAIDGRGASGKSVLADHIKKLLPDFVVLHGDDYFEPIENQVVWGAFNDERFIFDVIEPLKHGNSFVYQPYDWHRKQHILKQPTGITRGFCLERCFSFAFDLDWDLKIWVETPKEVCLERGVARESLPHECALAVWRDVWQPAEDVYIQNFHPMGKADLILDGTKPFEEQIS